MRLVPVTIATLLLPLQLPAQDTAFWLDEIDLKAMTQRRGAPLVRQAVALFNRGLEPRRIEARWSDLGIKGAQPVRNLWEQRDLGSFKGSYTVDVPRHGAVMLKIGQPNAAN